MTRPAKSTASRSKAPSPYAALLRGINVGGKNMLPMPVLTTMFVDAGCGDVRTYIQSGNVVFSATPALAARLPRVISEGITERYGFRAPVVLRTSDELRQVVARNPFLKSGADTGSLHVAFLTERPDPRHVAGLDPERSPGDSFSVLGREIYLYLPSGVAETKLTNAYFDSKLATTSTVRNWRTVLKLLEITRSTGDHD